MKIKELYVWDDVGYLENTATVPMPNNFKLPEPDWTIKKVNRVSTPLLFKEIKLRFKYSFLMNATYLKVIFNTNDKDYTYYGWVDKVSIISENPPESKIEWHVDYWRTYINDVSLGYGIVTRRPVSYVYGMTYSENPIQNIDYRYKKVNGFRNFPAIRGDMNDKILWSIISYVGGDPERVIIAIVPISMDPNVRLRFSGQDTKDTTVPYNSFTLRELTSTSISSLLGVGHDKLIGVWVSPIPPIPVISTKSEKGDQIIIDLIPQGGSLVTRNYGVTISDLLDGVVITDDPSIKHPLLMKFISYGEKGEAIKHEIYCNYDNVGDILLENWWGGEYQFEGIPSRPGRAVHKISSSGRFLLNPIDALKLSMDDDDYNNLVDGTEVVVECRGNHELRMIKARSKIEITITKSEYKKDQYNWVLTFDETTDKPYDCLVKYSGQWYGFRKIEGKLTDRILASEILLVSDKKEDIIFKVTTYQGATNYNIIKLTNNYGLIGSNNGAYSKFEVDIEPRLKPNEYLDIIFTDMDGRPIHQFPINLEIRKCEVRHVLSAMGAYLVFQFSGINSYVEGRQVTLPLPTLDVMSNVMNQYLMGGQRDYDLQMQQLSIQQSITSGVISTALGVISGGPGGALLGLAGVGINAASQKYYQDQSQQMKEKLTANQQDSVIMRGGSWDWIYNGRPPGFVFLAKDEYSIKQYNKSIKNYGIVTNEIFENCNDLIHNSGPWQIKDLYVDGKIPSEAKQYIKNRLDQGVYVEKA